MRPVHVVVSVVLTEKEYDNLYHSGRGGLATVLFTGPGTFSAAIRARLGWSEQPYGHTQDPEVISGKEYRARLQVGTDAWRRDYPTQGGESHEDKTK